MTSTFWRIFARLNMGLYPEFAKNRQMELNISIEKARIYYSAFLWSEELCRSPRLHNSPDHTQSHPVIANYVDLPVLHNFSNHTMDCVAGASHVFLQAARGEHAKGRGGACSEGHSFQFSTNSLTARRVPLAKNASLELVCHLNAFFVS